MSSAARWEASDVVGNLCLEASHGWYGVRKKSEAKVDVFDWSLAKLQYHITTRMLKQFIDLFSFHKFSLNVCVCVRSVVCVLSPVDHTHGFMHPPRPTY